MVFLAQIEGAHFMEKKILFFLWPQHSERSTVAQNKIGFWKEVSLKYYVENPWQQDSYHISLKGREFYLEGWLTVIKNKHHKRTFLKLKEAYIILSAPG